MSKKMTYASILKTLRKKRNLTQKEVAQVCDITPEYLSKIENDNKTPSMILLKKLAATYNVPLSIIIYLVEDAERKTTNTSKEEKELKALKDRMINYIFVADNYKIATLRDDLKMLRAYRERVVPAS